MPPDTPLFPVDADLNDLHRLLQNAEPGRSARPALLTPQAVSEWLQTNLTAGRESCELRFQAGLSYLDLHAFALAREQFRAALDLNAGYGRAVRGLAIAELGLGNIADAVMWHIKILEAQKTDDASRNSILRLMKRRDVPHELVRAMFKAMPLQYYELHPGDDAAVSPVAAFADWCRQTGVPVHELDPARDVGSADGVVGTPAYTADPIRVAAIPNARVVSGWDFVIAPTGEVLDGTGFFPLQTIFSATPHYLQDGDQSVIHVWPQQEIDIKGVVLFLSSPPFRNVGHWITDFLPRLRARGAIGERHVRLFLPHPAMRRYVEFLAMFGIDESDILYGDIGKRYKFETLYVMEHVDHNRPHPQTVRFLHQHLCQAAPKPARRIYLPRAPGASGRRPLNQPDVERVLASFDVAAVQLADLPAAQQREVLGGATLAITSCGAEMASIFSLPRGCELIVLVPSSDASFSDTGENLDQFRRQAGLLGMRIQLLACRPAPGATRIFNRDITVDAGALRDAIETALARQTQF